MRCEVSLQNYPHHSVLTMITMLFICLDILLSIALLAGWQSAVNSQLSAECADQQLRRAGPAGQSADGQAGAGRGSQGGREAHLTPGQPWGAESESPQSSTGSPPPSTSSSQHRPGNILISVCLAAWCHNINIITVTGALSDKVTAPTTNTRPG